MAKKRSLQIVNEHFELFFNAVLASAALLRQPLRVLRQIVKVTKLMPEFTGRQHLMNQYYLTRQLSMTLFILILVSSCVTHDREIKLYQRQTIDLHDDDLDGVINARDLCFKTPTGALVNNSGCPQWEAVLNQYEGIIHFERDSFIADTPEADKTLKTIARVAADHPHSTIILTGYASKPASEAYNLKLSQKRAEHIQQQLTHTFGLDNHRIKTRWRGEENPVQPGNTSAANLANQRVTALIIYEQNRPLRKWSAQTFPQPIFQ